MKGWHLWDVDTTDKDGKDQEDYLIVVTEKRNAAEAAAKAEQVAKEKDLLVQKIEHSGTIDA